MVVSLNHIYLTYLTYLSIQAIGGEYPWRPNVIPEMEVTNYLSERSPTALGCSSGTNCWEALKLNQRCQSTSLQRNMENHYSRSSRARLAVLFTVTFPWHDFVYTHLYTQKSKHCMMKVHVFLWSNLCPPKKSAFHSSHRAEAQPPPQGRKHV